MDGDSFYRGRKDSFDALGGAANPSVRQQHQDDTSSFFGRNSQYMSTNSHQAPSAGYNRDNFADPGRSMPVRGLEEEEFGRLHPKEEELQDPGWDVYNDFNNQGPRYSEAYGTGLSTITSSNPGSYQKIPNSASQHSFKIPPPGSSVSEANNVELVTVPAMGAEWKKSEIDAMRKKTHRDEANDERKRSFMLWWRDQKGGWATRKTLVIILFVLCCIAGIILAITIPRVPAFSFNAENPVSNNTKSSTPAAFSRLPANFSFPALVNIQVDTSSNIIPLKIKKIDTQLFCLDTDEPIGGGEFPGMTIAAKTFQPIGIPVLFNYSAPNDTDTTWLQFYNACRNKSQYSDGVRPGFNIRLILTTTIQGLLHSVVSSTQITKVSCPFELSNNSV